MKPAVARRQIRGTGECGDEGPGDEGGRGLADGSEGGLHGQQVLVGGRDEFEEDGAVDGLVAAGPHANEGAEGGNGGKVGAPGTHEAGHGGDEERHI